MGNDCLQLNTAGRVCYYPSPDCRPFYVPCLQDGLARILAKHTNSTAQSTNAYYNLTDGALLGGANMPLPAVVAPAVAVCLTGRCCCGMLVTTCYVTVKDNDFDSGEAQQTACRTAISLLRMDRLTNASGNECGLSEHSVSPSRNHSMYNCQLRSTIL